MSCLQNLYILNYQKEKKMFYDIKDTSLTRTILNTRRKILENSYSLFSTHGIFKTTMVDISHETGITRRTLYNHYNRKEDIALTLHKLLIDDILVSVVAENGLKTIQYLKNALYRIYREINSRSGSLHFIVHFDQFARENRDVIKKSDHFVNYLLANSPLSEYLGHFKNQGLYKIDSIDPDLYSKVFFESFIAFLERICYREITYLEEGSYISSDFKLYVDTMLSIIREEKKFGSSNPRL